MIVFMIVLISCSVHDNEDGKTNGNFGVIKKISLILEYGRDSVERPKLDYYYIEYRLDWTWIDTLASWFVTFSLDRDC